MMSSFSRTLFMFIILILDLALSFFFFFFNDTATTEIYTLSLHDALPICKRHDVASGRVENVGVRKHVVANITRDRKSTRLNSSHLVISYAVFCLKKKKKKKNIKMSKKI